MRYTPPEGLLRSEEEVALRNFPFVVRNAPLTPPPTLITDEPAHCAKINVLWLAHVLGALEALNQPEAWAGTDEQQWQARQQIEILVNQLKDVCEESGMLLRQSGCILEASTDGGQTWIEVYDVSPCIPEPPTIPPAPIFRASDCGLEVSYNNGGTWALIFDASCATPTEDIDFPDETHTEPQQDKACQLATYMIEIPLPTLLQNLISAKQLANNQNDLIVALLAMPAAVIATVATAGVAVVAWLTAAAAGAAAGAAGLSIYDAVDNMNITATQGELTPQFWQDVKCAIYCVLDDEVLLTEDIALEIAQKILDDLSGDYPNAAPVVAAMFASMSSAARGQYSAIGAYHAGSGCQLCGCEPIWIHNVVSDYPIHPTMTLISGQHVEYSPGLYMFRAEGISSIEFITDLSEYDCKLWRVQLLAPKNRKQKPLGVPPWFNYLPAWIKVRSIYDGVWYTVWETIQNIGGQTDDINPGFPFDGVHFYCETEPWTDPLLVAYFGSINLHGEGVNPYEEPTP